MKTVDDILAAARLLDAAQLLRLREKLDRLEQRVWDAELQVKSAQLKKTKLSDDKLDRLVMRRRREC